MDRASLATHLSLYEATCDIYVFFRPRTTDSDFVLKAMEGREDEINTCIGCNQACLDHTFKAIPGVLFLSLSLKLVCALVPATPSRPSQVCFFSLCRSS